MAAKTIEYSGVVFSGARCVLGLALLLMPVVSSAQSERIMSDPVFGLTYSTATVRFELAPAWLTERCRELPGPGFWIYARFKSADQEFFVVSNRRSEVSGAGIVIAGRRCSVGLPDWVLSGDKEYWSGKAEPTIRFTDEILRGLAQDLLRRYAEALGGKEAFLRAVRQLRNFSASKDLQPILRREFEQFAASAN